MTRSNILGLSLLLTQLVWLHEVAEAAVITQGAYDSFVAFEAEDYETITTTGTKQWIEVTTTSPVTSPVGTEIIPPDSNVSGSAALLADYGIGNHESTATYRIAFENTGDYWFYVRYSMYEHSDFGSTYGNEDSFYRPPTFNASCTSGDTNIVTEFSTTNVEGVYGWKDVDVSYEVSDDHVAASYVEFKIDNRERGLSIDRIVFSSVKLSTTALDLLWNSGDHITHFTDAESGDSSWATTGNWSNGVPTADKWVYVGDGTTANLDTGSGAALGLTLGHAAATATGGGTLNQLAGDLTVNNDMHIGVIDSSTATYNMSGGTATIGGNVVLGASGSSGVINLTGGQMNVSGDLTGGIGTSTLNVDGGTLDVGGNLTVESLRVGYNGRTAQVAVGGDTTLNSTSPLQVGYRDSATINPSAVTNGMIDLSGADSVNLNASALAVGTLYADLNQTLDGMLKLATTGTNSISVATITIGESTAGYTPTVKGALHLGSNNTINANTIYVGRRKAQGIMDIVSGGTLDLAGLTGGKTNLYIGYCDTATTATANLGTMNLLGGTFNASLAELVIGYHLYPWNDTVSGSGTGVLSFDGGTITTDTVNLGVGSSNAHSTYGFREGRGVGTLNMAGGSFQAGSVTLATGSTRSVATINLTGGTLAVTGSVTGGIGTSTLNVDGGAMTVGGDLIVDTLRVGYHTSEGDAAGRNASVITAGNGSVQIGSETERTNLYVGHTNQNLTEDVVGVLNLSGSASFTAYLNSFIIGQRTVGLEGYNGDAVGTVTLPDTSYIDATSIMISDQQMWIGADPSTLTLGANSTFKVNLFTVGANRANARLEFASGGTLTLGGPTGSKADLRIGYQTLGTGSTANSTADFSGGTLNATLDELVIGYANGKSTGGGKAFGAMLFSGGAVTANSVKIGDANASVGTGTGDGALTMSGGTFTVDGDITLGTGTSLSKGAINLSAGTLAADSITQGVGTGIMNFTGGTLHVDAFGSEARPFDLVQAGGTLAPGDSPGMTTIYGDYTMNAGALEIEINGLDQGDQGLVGDAGDEIGYDHVLVDGDASLTGNLNVLLLDDFAPELGSHFDVLQTTGSLDIAGLALNTDLAPLAFGWWEMSAIGGAGGEGGILRLSAVPEPSGVLLLILALLLGYARRSRQ